MNGPASNNLSSNRGYGIVETSIVLVLMSILIVVVMDRYERTVHEARKAALRAELANLRQAVTFFRITKSRYPKDLKELVTSKVVSPYKDDFISGTYLEPYSVDKDMNILDPFGLPYEYDPSTSAVRSKKKGFEYY